MATVNEVSYEKTVKEQLGNWLTFWYPNTPKTYGLCIFREVLEKYAAWDRFIKNYHQVPKQEGFVQVFEYIVRTKDIKMLLEWAFIWANTVEGVEYWKSLNNEIKATLQKKEVEGIKLTEIRKNTEKIIRHVGNNDFKLNNSHNSQHRHTRQFSQGEWATDDESQILSLLSGATQQFFSVVQNMGMNWCQHETRVKINVPLSKTTIRSISQIN